MGNRLKVKVISVGTYRLRLEMGHLMDLVDICYVPTISRNLVSLSRIDELGYWLSFGSGKFSIFYDSIKVGLEFCVMVYIELIWILSLQRH